MQKDNFQEISEQDLNKELLEILVTFCFFVKIDSLCYYSLP